MKHTEKNIKNKPYLGNKLNEKKCCAECNDGHGQSIYPMQGITPAALSGGSAYPGDEGMGVALEPVMAFPSHYQAIDEGRGIYTRCPACSRSQK